MKLLVGCFGGASHAIADAKLIEKFSVYDAMRCDVVIHTRYVLYFSCARTLAAAAVVVVHCDVCGENLL